MTCIIIEDEPLSAGVLQEYIHELDFLELKGVYRDAISAMGRISEEKIDLHFLDLHLPKLKGFDLLRNCRLQGQVIITTAYHEHALEGYEFGVTDYLLKPIAFDRFMRAVHKAREAFGRSSHQTTQGLQDEEDTLFFKSGASIHRIDVADITYLEKQGNYFSLYTRSGKTLLIRINFQDLISRLPVSKFVRVHKSYIVSLKQIDIIQHNFVQAQKKKIPVSNSFKEELMKRI